MSQTLNLKQAAQALAAGELILFPTETVYGLAANALDPIAVARIFEAKGRPRFNPIICHLSDGDALKRYATIDPLSAELIEAFWPGPLTLLLPHGGRIPSIATAGSALAAFRAPDHRLAQELLALCSFPLAAPSANLSGKRSPTDAAMALEQLGAAVAGVLDGGPCRIGLESTVVQTTGSGVHILREGGISREALLSAGFVIAETSPGDAPPAPGRLSNHYAPEAALVFIEGWDETKAAMLRELLAEETSRRGPRGVILSPGPIAGWLRELLPDYPLLILSPEGDLRIAAAELFRTLDRQRPPETGFIIAIAAPERDLGRAINDRLRRGAAVHIVPDAHSD